MKNKRQEKILQLIERYEIGSQSDLREMLHSYGFRVAQATLSRDIRDLNITKIQSTDGTYRYVSSINKKNPYILFQKLYIEYAVSTRCSQNLIAITCRNRMASAISYALDHADIYGVVASLARFDHIFVLCHDNIRAKMIHRLLTQFTVK